MIDLANYDLTAQANAGADIDILDPYTLEKFAEPVVFRVLGSESDERFKVESELARELSTKQSGADIDIEDFKMKIYAKLVVKVTGLQMDGVEVSADYETIYKLFKKYNWIYRQVKLGIDKRENFLAKPSEK